MKPLTFQVPSKIIYGKNSVDDYKEIFTVIGKKALIITDEIMLKIGNAKKVTDILEKLSKNFTVYSGVNSEPDSNHVKEALKVCEEAKCDYIISIGGGSCIDLAKTVSVLANRNHTGIKPVDDQIEDQLKHVAIPTTAGTGSEVTNVCVITDLENNEKVMMQKSYYTPTIALVDPQFTYSCPNKIIASTGVDAFCHAIESLMSVKANAFSQKFAWSAIDLILNNLEKAYLLDDNEKYMDKVALASLEAGVAFPNASVCLVHGMSRPVGAIFHIPHGISNAMLLETVLEFSKEKIKDILEGIGEIVVNNNLIGEEYPEEAELSEIGLYKIKNMVKTLNIPTFSEWGIEETNFRNSLDKMARDAMLSGSPQNNPIVPTEEEIKELYIKSF